MPHPRLRLALATLCAVCIICVCAALVHSQSNALRRLTDTPETAISLNPMLSGDGRHVVFETTENLTGASGGIGFHAVRADISDESTRFLQLAASRAPAAAISQDGSHIAFSSRDDLLGTNLDGNPEIFLYDGAQLQQITDTAPDDPSTRAQQGNFQPSISDDGRFIAFSSNRNLTGANADRNLEIFLYDHAQQLFTQLTDTNGTRGATSPKLSGEASRIAFIRDNNTNSASSDSHARDLMLYERATQTTRTLAFQANNLSLTYGRAISDDGLRVVYSANTSTNSSQVFLYDGRNEMIRQLTTLGSRVSDVPLHPSISGDGSRISFATRRNVNGGNPDASVELYLYDVPTNQFARLTSAPANATGEVVSSLNDDGSLVAFNFPRALTQTVSDNDFANNSEIYLIAIPQRTPFSSDLRVTHAATFGKEPSLTKTLAPSQIAIVNGLNFSLSTAQLTRLPDNALPRTFKNTTVFINGRAAQLFYVSPTQINFLVPAETEIGTAQIIVRNHDGYESHSAFMVQQTAPGVFSERGDGSGEAIALEAQTFSRTPFDPIDAMNHPRRLIIFATGIRNASQVEVLIGGRALTVESVVPSPDLPGLDEIHIRLSGSLAGAGLVPLLVRADGRESNSTSIRFSGTRRAARLALAPTSSSMGVGRALKFNATVFDDEGTQILDAPVVFSSTAPSVASIDERGNAHGLNEGTTIIRASSGDIIATADLRVHRLSLIINEVLADPPDGLAGDANHDNERSAAQDEFIELVNTTDTDLDIGSYQILTRASNGSDTLRHIFPTSTILPPATAAIVFGGANAATFDSRNPAFAGAQIFTASTGGLSLINGGSTITLLDSAGMAIDQMTYGGTSDLDGDRNQSLTRAPDLSGDFALHQSVADAAGRLFSPGTHTNGRPFDTSSPIARIEVAPSPAEIFSGATRQFIAHAFAANGEELQGIIFQWQSSNASVATIDRLGLARSVSSGTTEIVARARGAQSAPAQLIVREIPPVLTRIEVMPSALTLASGVEQQFNARAFDQFGREMSNITFTWASSNASIANIDQRGLAKTNNIGGTNISASALNVSGAATLNVIAPALVFNEVLADPPDGVAGDANHDGIRSGTDDEFIEFSNASSTSLDIAGWTIRTRPLNSTTETLRHTFGVGTSLPAHDSIVVFGGGSFDPANPVFGGAQIVSASTGGLSLTNSGLTIILRDTNGQMLTQFAYGTGQDDFGGDSVNQSITRAPDVSGAFVRHTFASGAGARKFSPGTKLDGSFFAPRPGRLTRVNLTPVTATVIAGRTTQFTAQAFDQYDRTMPSVNFMSVSSDTNVAKITDISTDHSSGLAIVSVSALNAGTTQITATANNASNSATSNSATLQVTVPPPIVQRVEVTPASVNLNRGQSQQFSAQAFDQNNQIIASAVFTWSTSNTQIATIDAGGLLHGTGIGSVTITATTGDGAGRTISGQATLTSQAPLVINEILADVPPDNLTTSAVEGDTNHDGVRNADDDEFIELLNNSNAPVDLSGIVIADANSNRHTFAANTVLAAGRCLVIFGGGSPPANDPAFGGALVLTTTSLGLNDSGDTVMLKLPQGGDEIVIASQSFGNAAPGGVPPAPSDQSLTRTPDAEVGTNGGNFIAHSSAINAATRVFSPGTRADGTPFGSAPITRIEVAPATVQLEIGATQSFSARAYSNASGTETEVTNVSFIWDSTDTTKASVVPAIGTTTNASALAAGTTLIRARAGGQQAISTLTVNPPPPVLTRVDLSPASTNITVGGTQQFTAQAFDQFNQPFNAATFIFASSDTNAATIDSIMSNANGSAIATVRGRNAGSAQIIAQARDGSRIVNSNTATLTITPIPSVPSAGQVIINEALVAFATSSTQPRNDFIELYNTTDQTLDISGLIVSFRPTGSGNTPATVALPGAVASQTTLLQPHNYFLIVNGAETFGVRADFNASASSFDLNNTTGGIKIEIEGVKLDGLSYQGGTTAPAPPFNVYGEGSLLIFTSGTTNDLIRSPNAIDTNNNATDFRRNGTTASVTAKAANP